MRETIKLPFISRLELNLKEHPDFIQVILGPRQVGKTTTTLWFFEHHFEREFHYISADKIFNASHNWLLENWQIAREKDAVLIVDEIQKIENWAESIKGLWDEERRRKSPITCLLLGSSSLEIQRGLTESLTGRFQLIKANHWNFQESSKAYDLTFDEYLKFGGYPGSYRLIKDEENWVQYVKNSIVSTVIEKDILLNHTVKSPALFKQAFEILISYPAQEISYTKLLGQLQNKGNTELIKHYIHLFEGAFLLRPLEKYSSKAFKTKSSSPKILPLCPSFYYISLLSEYTAEEKGRVFELLVGAQLHRTELELYYWREGADEVDYVLKKGKKLWAIEVKSGRKKSAKGLEAFKKKHPSANSVIITLDNYQEFEKSPVTFLEKLS